MRRYQPQTIGQASRIPGMTPAAIVALLRHLRKISAAGDIAGRSDMAASADNAQAG
ncbi:MAG: hypothetical protein ACPHRH_06115 [Candidatus Puniceispirillaceae bacterium]